jgi:hypothetical protein
MLPPLPGTHPLVGGTAAAGFVLYLVAKLISFLFGISLR